MTAWALSPSYGSVVLGPAQAATLAAVHALTGAGRRPYVTLARLSSMTGRATSSTHAALGRLRALGLIGCATRMGRHGGSRLWRPSSKPRREAGRTLDTGRHRRAIARVLGAYAREDGTRNPPPDYAGIRPPDPPATPPPPAPADPPRQDSEAEGEPSPRRFAEAMERYGFRKWWTDD